MNYYVFGASNIDIYARLDDKAIMHESNPSIITINYGGVGRNIARAISNYKEVSFISAFSDSLTFKGLIDDLINHHININMSKYYHNDDSIYLSVSDKDGMVIGASSMSLIDELKIVDLRYPLSLTKRDDIVVLDTNSKTLAEYIINNTESYKVMDAVSSIKLNKVKDLIDKVDLIKLNKYEYEKLGTELKNDYIITEGNGGIIKYKDKKVRFKHKVSDSVNTNGCGDTFLGTFISNIDRGLNEAIKEAVKASYASSLILEAVPLKEEIDNINIDDLDLIIEEVIV